MGLWSILDATLGKAKGVPFTDRAFVLVANRLIHPASAWRWVRPDLRDSDPGVAAQHVPPVQEMFSVRAVRLVDNGLAQAEGLAAGAHHQIALRVDVGNRRARMSSSSDATVFLLAGNQDLPSVQLAGPFSAAARR